VNLLPPAHCPLLTDEEWLFMALDPATNPGDLSLREAEHVLASLDQRVQRLEDAVADLQERYPLPQAKGPMPFEADKVMAGAPTNERHGEPEDVPAPARASVNRPPWLLFEIYQDFKAMVRMFFDVHYHVAWSTRLIAIVLLLLFLTSEWWFPLAYIPLLGGWLDKMLDLLLAFLAYKVLSREARRYRDSLSGHKI
jgi:hypothetical protein